LLGSVTVVHRDLRTVLREHTTPRFRRSLVQIRKIEQFEKEAEGQNYDQQIVFQSKI
jgi:hypothetical protein